MSIVVVDAPSNLGLRPPRPGTVPGCYKLAGALRDQGLLARLGAQEGGVVTPPRYDRGGWVEGDGVFNAAAIARYSVALADRVQKHTASGGFVLVLGGDCSILLGALLGLRRRGRTGLVYLDGHSDFRHPGNSPAVGAAAGEGLALVTGRGQPDLTDLEGLGPYVRGEDAAALGMHEPGDPLLAEARAAVAVLATVEEMRAAGCAAAAGRALAAMGPGVERIWVHLDADVLDPSVMPAVDSPDPGGLEPGELVETLVPLLSDPRVAGLDLAIYDPDLDEPGYGARLLADLLVEALGAAGRIA
ncbi:MAG TPA: arginase family protein [Pseudonocardia sp.]|jgi:arginase|uniref:arginase family protein n=1 Tax=Pseudonocardia sp. TaxID=60912 RepID=UPI002B4ACD3B|nr:arginase family protein [Pseudonocardia sp.]HLU56004.1 arginase family protein [Pseudonocardia sp.]